MKLFQKHLNVGMSCIWSSEVNLQIEYVSTLSVHVNILYALVYFKGFLIVNVIVKKVSYWI